MHERVKICVNFSFEDGNDNSNGKGIKHYDDNITTYYLLNKINKFIDYLNQNGIENIRYIQHAYFQSNNENEYGILFYSEYSNNNEDILENIIKYTNNELKVFGYFNSQKKEIKYVKSETRLNYKYYDFIWKTSLTSFIQPNFIIGDYIHQKVKTISETSQIEEFCGLGGEMGIYSKLFLNSNKNLTDSLSIYEDCKINDVSSYLVDYRTVQLKDYFNSDKKKILIVNISRNGLKGLAYQLVDMIFDKIIYIGCSEKSVRRDMEILKTKYDIDERIQKDNIFLLTLNFNKNISISARLGKNKNNMDPSLQLDYKHF